MPGATASSASVLSSHGLRPSSRFRVRIFDILRFTHGRELNRMALLNVREVSEWLQVKRSTIYLWAEQSMIPHMKLGRLLRFDPDEIKAWLQAHRQEVTPEPIPSERRHGIDNVDVLIARAKAEAYNSCRETRQDRAKPGGE